MWSGKYSHGETGVTNETGDSMTKVLPVYDRGAAFTTGAHPAQAIQNRQGKGDRGQPLDPTISIGGGTTTSVQSLGFWSEFRRGRLGVWRVQTPAVHASRASQDDRRQHAADSRTA